jgi:hypothetical protein
VAEVRDLAHVWQLQVQQARLRQEQVELDSVYQRDLLQVRGRP